MCAAPACVAAAAGLPLETCESSSMARLARRPTFMVMKQFMSMGIALKLNV
jgi:hypothetical protein